MGYTEYCHVTRKSKVKTGDQRPKTNIKFGKNEGLKYKIKYNIIISSFASLLSKNIITKGHYS